jgi:hypothetical protein
VHRGELEQAYESHRALSERCLETGDWNPFADQFTEDATYRRPGRDLIVGREAIRAWVCGQLSTFPATEFAALDVLWHGVDARLSTIAYELRATMRDPGDGSVHHASTVTTLLYAGDGLFSQCVDVNSPTAYLDMWRRWTRVAARFGTVDPADEGYLEIPSQVS